uniref:UBC core domain-containing protein n=1 Tax=Accipiter nisus TaxID=211598 RepID=A0A8B9MY39_9AVES
MWPVATRGGVELSHDTVSTPPTPSQVGQGYPHDPPKVKCETMVYHPNIDLEGNVCLNILREDWKPVLTINSIIYGLQYLFLVSTAGVQAPVGGGHLSWLWGGPWGAAGGLRTHPGGPWWPWDTLRRHLWWPWDTSWGPLVALGQVLGTTGGLGTPPGCTQWPRDNLRKHLVALGHVLGAPGGLGTT